MNTNNIHQMSPPYQYIEFSCVRLVVHLFLVSSIHPSISSASIASANATHPNRHFDDRLLACFCFVICLPNIFRQPHNPPMSIIAAPVTSRVEAAAQRLTDNDFNFPLARAVNDTVVEFRKHENRSPSVLLLGGAFDSELVEQLFSLGCNVTLVSPDGADLDRCRASIPNDDDNDDGDDDGAQQPTLRVVCKSPVQLPLSKRYDMLVNTLFGGMLNAKGAALYASDLHRRKIIKVFHHAGTALRYVVPFSGTMTARLYHINDVDIGLVGGGGIDNGPVFRPHTTFGGLPPLQMHHNTFALSPRVDVLYEDYERGTTQWPAEVELVPDRCMHSAPVHSTALVLEWTLQLSRFGNEQWTTAVSKHTTARRARVLAWPNPIAPTIEWIGDSPTFPEHPLRFKVQCKPAGKLDMIRVLHCAAASASKAVGQKTYTPARLETLFEATYAVAVKHTLKAAKAAGEAAAEAEAEAAADVMYDDDLRDASAA